MNIKLVYSLIPVISIVKDGDAIFKHLKDTQESTTRIHRAFKI